MPRRWSQRDDMLLLAHKMTLAEIAELLGRSEVELHARADELGLEVSSADDAGTLTLRLHPELAQELAAAADAAGKSLDAFCRDMLRRGFLAHTQPPEALPELLSDGRKTIDWSDQSKLSMPSEAAALVARRVMLQLCRGSIEQARQALESGWQSHVDCHGPTPVGPELLDHPLANVLDDIRLLNCLEQHGGIVTVGQFLNCGEAKLLALPQMGHTGLLRLRNLASVLRHRAGLHAEVA
jgi:hypothetical protein